MRKKTALAPWHTGHCYRAEWNKDITGDDRPETTYKEAHMYATIPPAELHHTHSFPTTDENDNLIEDPIPDQLVPTILLPHDGHGNDRTERLMYIDLDDVRDPDTGEVTSEVGDLVNRLDSFTEVSASGTGLHVLVYAELPYDGWINGEPLDDEGSIEIYDHGRFFGGTWHHVAGTPRTINERQDVIDEIVEAYATDWLETKRAKAVSAYASETSLGTSTPGDGRRRSGSGSSAREGQSPYFDVHLAKFADPDPVERSSSSERQGAHPHHGKTTAGETSYNYNLDTGENCWYCHAHNAGGGPMEMAAIMAGELVCRDAGAGALERLSDEAFLRVCLYARDHLDGYIEDMIPPYRALVTVAERYDLSMHDDGRGILGATTHECANAIYGELDAESVQ